MKTVTILTPAYNRKELLERLYNSLKKQTVSDFQWLIVDDGSLDGTKECVQRLQKENSVDIHYIWQENAGKHCALNKAIPLIESELTFIVDSDDYLPEEAVEIILSYHQKYKNTEGLCGYSFLRCYEDGSVNTAYFKKDEEIASYLEIRINGRIGGDKAEVFFTRILQQFPFPEFKGEKFLPEDLVWMKMSESYQMVHINKCVYISEYLEGGLTKSGRSMKIHSPKGMVARSKVYLDNPKVCLRVKVKMMLLYQIYGRFANQKNEELMADISEKFLYLFLFIPARFIIFYWRRKL